MITNPEVIRHWPPQWLVGRQLNEEKNFIAKYEDDFCILELLEIDCEWNYSNPTGVFNLSLPDKLMRSKNYTFISY